MRYYQGVVFDIDNTAVPEGSLEVTSVDLVEAFRSLSPSIPAIAATGRTVEYAQPITSQLALHHESIVANGAQVMDSMTGRILREDSLNVEQVREIIELCRQHDSTAHCCIAGDPMGSRITADQQVAREAPGVFFMDLSEEVASSFSDALISVNGIRSYVTSVVQKDRTLYDVNIGGAEAEKGIALRGLLARKEIDPNRMVAVGDGINDISLFEVVGYRIAMADAHPDLLAAADEVVAPQSENGLLSVIRRFL